MFRSLAIWTCLIAASGGALFHTSYRVQTLEGKLARINRDITDETQGIQVLKAEWSYLNAPSHLQALVQNGGLSLQATKATQIGSVDSIPQRPAGAPDPLQVAAAAPPVQSLPEKVAAAAALEKQTAAKPQVVAEAHVIAKAPAIVPASLPVRTQTGSDSHIHKAVIAHTQGMASHAAPDNIMLLLARVEKISNHPASPSR